MWLIVANGCPQCIVYAPRLATDACAGRAASASSVLSSRSAVMCDDVGVVEKTRWGQRATGIVNEHDKPQKTASQPARYLNGDAGLVDAQHPHPHGLLSH